MARLDVGGGGASTRKPIVTKPAPKPVYKKDYEKLQNNPQKTLPKTGVYTPPKAPVKKSTPKAPAKSTSYSSGGGGGGGGGGVSGGGGGGASINLAPPKPAYDPMKDPTYLASMAKLNDLWTQASGYKGQIDGMMTAGFTYDPETDASYKSLQTLATKQAGIASTEAMEDMSDRGILNSTVTSDRMGQIQQTAQDAVTAQVPGLKNAAYGQYMDKLSTLNNLWNSTVAQAQQERGFSEDKRRWELGYEMDQKQFQTGVDQWNKTFDYQAAQDSIQNAFKGQQMELDLLNYDLDYLASVQDSIGVNNKQATQAAIADLLNYKSKADIIKRLQSMKTQWYNGGANLSEIIRTMNTYYPGLEEEAKGKKLL